MDDAKTKNGVIHPAFLPIFCALLAQPQLPCPDCKNPTAMQQLPAPWGPCAALLSVTAPGMGGTASAEHQEAGPCNGILRLLAGLLGLLPSLPARLRPPAKAAEVHHRSVEGKSFVSSKLRKQLWKQSPQNHPKQGQVYRAYEFLTRLGSEHDFSCPEMNRLKNTVGYFWLFRWGE